MDRNVRGKCHLRFLRRHYSETCAKRPVQSDEHKDYRMGIIVRGFIFGLMSCCALTAQTNLPGARSETAFAHAPAYVFGASGSFVGIQADFKVNSMWYLSRVEGIAPLLPPVCPHGAANCYWRAANMIYDIEEATVFAVLPQKQS